MAAVFATLRTGRRDGTVSSWNLFWENGTRMSSIDVTWLSAEDKDREFLRFCQVVNALRNAGIVIHGDLER